MSAPPRHLTTVPSGATSVRPAWDDLPAAVRAVVEGRCGEPVVEALSQGGGFTPGFASRLLLGDGRRVFVKAADDETRGMFAAAYRQEVQVVPLLPAGVPAPRLQWVHDADGWVVVAFDDVDGRHPHRPWQPGELERVLQTLTTLAATVTPVPDGFDVPTFGSVFGDDVENWTAVDHPRAAELHDLAATALPSMGGSTLVHTDIREDNLILDGSAKVWICDWNWVCAGASWIDAMTVLIAAYGDGLDADAVLAAHPLTAGVPSAVLDGFLALLLGYFVRASAQDAPAMSPYLREHQSWYAAVLWSWLGDRLGWS